MNSKIATMGLFAVLMVAAFAGIVVTGEDADAAGGYTVTYEVNDMTYSKQSESATVTLPTLEDIGASVDAGKSFIGWKVKGENTIYAVGSTYKIADGTTPGTGAVTFVAEMPADKYTVTLAYEDGTIIKAYSKTDTTDTRLAYSAQPTLTLPTKATSVAAGKVLEFRQVDGEIFVGWALAEDPETVVIAESESKIAVTEDADYVAVYAHDPTVSFIVDGATIIPSTPEYKLVLPSAPSKDGFKFVGWSDGELTVRDEELSTYVSLLVDDVVLTAVWEPAVYTVAFVVDGETVLTQSVKHGETATEPKIVPAKDGFSFSAWTVGDVAYDFSTAITGDLTVTASFEAVPAPAPTGLKDPTTQMLLIIIGTLVLGIVAVGVWKRDVIRAGLVKRLDKGDKGNGGDGTA